MPRGSATSPLIRLGSQVEGNYKTPPQSAGRFQLVASKRGSIT